MSRFASCRREGGEAWQPSSPTRCYPPLPRCLSSTQNLVEQIAASKYSSGLLAATSMHTLLIAQTVDTVNPLTARVRN